VRRDKWWGVEGMGYWMGWGGEGGGVEGGGGWKRNKLVGGGGGGDQMNVFYNTPFGPKQHKLCIK